MLLSNMLLQAALTEHNTKPPFFFFFFNLTAPITQCAVFTAAVFDGGGSSKSNTLLLIFHIGFNKSLSMNGEFLGTLGRFISEQALLTVGCLHIKPVLSNPHQAHLAQ